MKWMWEWRKWKRDKMIEKKGIEKGFLNLIVGIKNDFKKMDDICRVKRWSGEDRRESERMVWRGDDG